MSETSILQFEILELVLVGTVLIYCTYTDIKSREINDFACLAIVAIWLLGSAYNVLIYGTGALSCLFQIIQSLIFLVLLLLVCYVFERLTGKLSFGGGDVKLMSACSLYFGTNALLAFIFLACVIGVFSSALTKYKATGFPFAPGITVSFLVIYSCSNIFTLF